MDEHFLLPCHRLKVAPIPERHEAFEVTPSCERLYDEEINENLKGRNKLQKIKPHK
jgi:hypothetical protein